MLLLGGHVWLQNYVTDLSTSCTLDLGGFLEGRGVFLGVEGFLGGTAPSWVFLEDRWV